MPVASLAPVASLRPVEPRTLGRTNVLILIVVALVTIVAFLGYHATLGEHEVFAAEPAREMLDGGNWLLQPFAGAYRTKKPPGQSWLIAVSMFVTQARNEYTARLPSALAATTLALLLGAIGARLAGRRVGLIAGLMTLTCYAVQVRARLAEADMALAFAVAASYAGVLLPLVRQRGLAEARIAREAGPARVTWITPLSLHGAPRLGVRFYDGLIFWLALALAFLLKGPIAFGFVLLPIAGFLIIASLRWADDELRGARHVVAAAMLNPIGIAVGLLLVVGWPVGALLTYPAAWEQWKYELLARAAGEIRRDSVVAYLGYLPLAALPWTIFAIYAVVIAWPTLGRRLRDPAALLLVLWIGLSAAFLTGIAFKRLHYALPAIAPLLLLSAWGFCRAAEAFAERFAARREAVVRGATIGWFGVVGIAWIAHQSFVEPRADAVVGSAVRSFASDVNAAVPAGEPIWLVGVGEERTVWYLRRPFVQTRYRDTEPLAVQVERLPPGESWVLCRLPNVEELRPLVNGIDVVVTSRTYREKRPDEEVRVLARVVATAPPQLPATVPNDPIR